MDTNESMALADWIAVNGRDCPSRTVVEVLANKWALYVLGALRRFDRPLRFSELRRLLEGITQKMLTQTLRALERDGLIERAVYPTVPPRVEYGLTPLGVEAGRLTSAISEWSVANVAQILDARAAYDAHSEQPLERIVTSPTNA
ncbi:helix-turn-helix transcriptional regulator [Kribbella qitaiheensis]|uniref:Helix-turn-helix transcriptional regulator n=1 Tax=Kribbella qitaiheensis TaxID=1544730 RepID=A0A7G6WX82_9ACTN|nr:helix-turn-helix domain-containing protein [Kribbella qitaiheensis]QNE18597.1 helix-turn-helix transcriptional regulator [Kribbella qitaiheensis]